MKIFIIILVLGLTSCATNYYISEVYDLSATVSFSNLSDEIPEINIITNCISKKINNKYIEKKKPSRKSKYKITIPADEIISFNYKYFWVSGESTKLITYETSYHSFINSEVVKEIKTCNEIISFKPESGKHYEVYFGKNVNNCLIKASEVYFDFSKNKNILYAIQEKSPNKC